MRSVKKSIARVFITSLMPPFLLLAHFIHCDTGGGFLGLQTFPYICMNGTADTSRTTSVENTEKCTACDQGYRLLDESCRMKGIIKEAFPYVCTNGTASTNGMSTKPGTERCTGCSSGYLLQGDLTCGANYPYVCTNGTPIMGTTSLPNTERCDTCETGYIKQANETCLTGEPSPAPLAQIAHISARGDNTCVVADGGARCWGHNEKGQLGDNTETQRTTPVQVMGLTSGVTRISAGGDHTCALAGGEAFCWGNGQNGELGDSMGDGMTPRTIKIPERVMGDLISGITQVSAGDNHTCAVANGRALCWGANNQGQLGITLGLRNTPQQVSGGLTTGVTQISAGRDHTCAVVDGRAMCWGSSTFGRLGNGVTRARGGSPKQVTGLTTGVTQISAGRDHSCAVVDGAAKCWGSGGSGQLGDNTATRRTTPVQVMGLTSEVTQISVGFSHSCAVVDGRAMCWGINDNGQLGVRPAPESGLSKTPLQVYGLTSGVTQISAGQNHTCALVNGRVRCWGSGGSGQLGNNSTEGSPVPITVSGL